MGIIANEIPLFDNHERFISKIKVGKKDDCWEWLAGKSRNGYGVFSINDKSFSAHRVSWAITKGALDTSLVLDHVCRNRACVNPDHLREVSRAINAYENNSSPVVANLTKTKCIRGHDLLGDNLYIAPASGDRACRKCRMFADRKYKAKRRVL